MTEKEKRIVRKKINSTFGSIDFLYSALPDADSTRALDYRTEFVLKELIANFKKSL